MSWWDLGEYSGVYGSELNLSNIHCGFCGESGGFQTDHHAERKHPNTGKILNYDILNCIHCGNLTMVFWSASSGSMGGSVHSFKQVPWPTVTQKSPDHWSENVGRYWLQAERSIEAGNWDAAALMARSAIQLIVRGKGANGNNLKQEIDDLAEKGELPPIMKEWAHEVRLLANQSAHPDPEDAPVEKVDAKAVVDYLTMMSRVIFDLPHDIEKMKARKA